MLAHFPQAVPEIPVSNVEKAAEYYVNALGFQFDWGNDQGGIGGISQGDCRMFLTNAPFRQNEGNSGTVIVWLNLDSRQEVDELLSVDRTPAAIEINNFAAGLNDIGPTLIARVDHARARCVNRPLNVGRFKTKLLI